MRQTPGATPPPTPATDALGWRGLGARLTFWFLAFALVPLLGVSLVGLHDARENLKASAIQTVTAQARLEANAIRAYMDQMVTTLQHETRTDRNLAFMQALAQDFQSHTVPLERYVRSPSQAQLVFELGATIQDLRLLSGYYDVLFIDPGGNVLYTLAGENDLGTNVYAPGSASASLGDTVRLAMDSGGPVFSDLQRYEPSGNRVSGFVAAPFIDTEGHKIGTMVLQITTDNIIEVLANTQRRSMIDGITYLIGADGRLRSPGPGHPDDYLGKAIDTALSRTWLQHLDRSEQDASHGHANELFSLLYRGPLGQEVIGAIYPLQLPRVTWAIIAEVDTQKAFTAALHFQYLAISLLAMTIIVVSLATLPITRSIVRPVLALREAVGRVRSGDLEQRIVLNSNNELGQLADGFNTMVEELREAREQDQANEWLQRGRSQLNDAMRGDQGVENLAHSVLTHLCHHLGIELGAFYLVRNERVRLIAGYALDREPGETVEFALGQGPVGQAALENRPLVLDQLPANYLTLRSGLGSLAPTSLSILPLSWNGRVVAVLELAGREPLGEQDLDYLEQVGPGIGIALETALARAETERLLAQTQAQAEELQAREEELRESNRLLQGQAQDLRRSEDALLRNQAELQEKNAQLQVQQEELRVANQELAQRAQDLENATRELARRAEEVSQASRYKSEFLANMSHELRTPLNSLLILARLLAENKDGNLQENQVKFAQTIHDSGRDLLNLINDILDLSKIEAGRMEVHAETLVRDDFVADLQRQFEPLAQSKGIALELDAGRAPTHWHTDGQKLGQVLRNLLSNAIKFTAQGRVALEIGPPPERLVTSRPSLAGLDRSRLLAFSVSDSGIGIPASKRKTIFEAFHQGDGTTSRKYGGTGLGLTISRELVHLLGGELLLESEEGKGSTFHVLLPPEPPRVAAEPPAPTLVPTPTADPHAAPAHPAAVPAVEIADDRAHLKAGERAILIIEDDANFAEILAGIARERAFKVLLASEGETGLHLADYHQPSGIILDVGLPGISGFKVLEYLKENPRTRHIPVHFISAADRQPEALKSGAVGFLTKPVDLDAIQKAFVRIEHVIDRPLKRLLLVEDDPAQRASLGALLGGGEDLEVISAATGAEARQLLAEQAFDCLVLDLGLEDMNGLDLLESLREGPLGADSQLPVVVYTGRDLEPRERHLLNRYAQSIIIKDAHSPERLLDDTALFLHRVESNLPQQQRRILRMLHDREALFKGRKVLLVDDDMRNVFALSAALQEREMNVITATNGVEALEALEAHPDTAIVLMDIMMPEMDGYEAMRRIRAQERFARLPIIALTAKAMKGDRALCIEAGASDYLAKPVEAAKLISMMRVWLYSR